MANVRSTEEIERGLHILAMEAGNATKASEQTGIPVPTLKKWKNDVHRERYEQIRVQLEDRLSRDLAEEMVELGKQRLGILRKLAVKAEEALDSGDMEAVHKLAGADRNFATSAGILTQNSRVLMDKPTDIIENRYDVAALDEGLRRLGLLVDSTAVEIEQPSLDSGETQETPAEAGVS